MSLLFLGLIVFMLALNLASPTFSGPLRGVSFILATPLAELSPLWLVVCLAATALTAVNGDLYAAAAFAAASLLLLRAALVSFKNPNAVGEGLGLSWWLRPAALHHSGVERLGGIAYGPGARHRLDLYRARGAKGPLPVLLQIHGGGWLFGDRRLQARPLMLHFAANGWLCISISYGLSPKVRWPGHLYDCKRALVWARQHIAEYGGDPERLVVTGGSAGGHLASWLALSANDPKLQPELHGDTSVKGCISFYGCYDVRAALVPSRHDPLVMMLARAVFGADVHRTPERLDEASPMLHAFTTPPPFLVIHGSADNIVPVEQARRFVKKLEASGAKTAYLEYPGAVHGFDMLRSVRTASAITAALAFAERVVAAPVP